MYDVQICLILPEMNEEQKEKLNELVKDLKGTVSQWTYVDPHVTKEKIIIEYDVRRKR